VIRASRPASSAPAASVPVSMSASGGQLLSIVPLGDTYVVANFKETQLDRLRIGQTVEIKADAFPG
jgi:multidrug resistance efflux pump